MIRALVRTAFFAALCAVVGPAYAQGPLQLASDVFVEREIAKPDGTKAKLLEEPKTVVPGDQLVFVCDDDLWGAHTDGGVARSQGDRAG